MPRRLGSVDGPSRRFDNFTNRVSDLEAIDHVLALPAGTPLPVMMFWGVGGAGKSWLLRKLRDSLPPGVPSALLDLEPNAGGAPYHTDAARALGELRRQFDDVPFPRFDLAYAWLRYKEGVRGEPLLRGSGPTAAVFELLTDAVPGMAEGIPGVSWLVKQMSKRASRRLKDSALEGWLAEKVGQEDFQRLRHSHPQDLYAVLADRFLLDAAEHLPPRGSAACRGVVFLDTFETLRVGVSGGAAALQREQWVRSLVALDSPLLVVIAGRDRIEWDAVDPDFAEDWCLRQRLVGGLSEIDARRFLRNCGVSDLELQDAVLRVSLETGDEVTGGERGYHPFSLGLSTDTIVAESAHGRMANPSTFAMAAGDTAALTQRFLKSLNDATHEAWIRRLAVTPRFDEEAARRSFSSSAGAAQDAAWAMLRGCSFLRETDDPTWITLHAIMRAALVDMTEAVDHHRFWESEWSRRSAMETDEYAALAWYHRYSIDPAAATEEWFELAERILSELRMSEHSELLGWWEPVGLLERSDESPTTGRARMLLGIQYWNAGVGERQNNLERALECYEKALQIYTEALFPRQWANNQTNLGMTYQAMLGGNRAVNLDRAVRHYMAALRVQNPESYPANWAGTKNNIGTVHAVMPYGDRAENLSRAIECYVDALTVFTERDFPEDWLIAQTNLGEAYQLLPVGSRVANLERASACLRDALRVANEERYPLLWAFVQNNLGNALVLLDHAGHAHQLEEAESCYSNALRVFTRQDFPRDWAVVVHNKGLAQSLRPSEDRTTNANAAISAYREAESVLTEHEFPRDWAVTRLNLGNALASTDRSDISEAIDCYLSCLRVLTASDYPREWSSLQHSLGVAYATTHGGDRPMNLMSAAAALENALAVQTASASPHEFAIARHNLGVVRDALGSNGHEVEQSDVFACYNDALRVLTMEEYPMERAVVLQNLDRMSDARRSDNGRLVAPERLLRQRPIHLYRE